MKNGRVYSIDPNLANRPGPRVVEGLEIIAWTAAPDRVPGRGARDPMGVAVQGVRIGRRVRALRAGRYAIAGALLAVTFVLGLMVGRPPWTPATVLGILASALPFGHVAPWWPESHGTILLEIRLPRVVMGALVGAALSVAGASYQGLFRNPLADPYLIGVAGGAGLGAAIAMVAPLPPVLYSLGIVQLAAFLSAMITVGMVYSLARVGRSTPVTTLLLAGVAMGSLASAATAFVMYSEGDKIDRDLRLDAGRLQR